MSILKKTIVFFAFPILIAAGSLGISDFFFDDSVRTETELKQLPTDSREFKFSKRCKTFLDHILNEGIDKVKIENELASLSPGFERDFLLALLNKRKGKFDKSFNLLLPLTNELPEYLDYYEELASLGKITGNLEEILKLINKKDSTHTLLVYLKGLVSYQKGRITEAIKNFQNLTEKGFASKEIFYQMSYCYRMTGDYEKSIASLIEAENLCSGEDPFLARIINLRGAIFYLSGNYDQAEKEYGSAKQIAKKNRNTSEEIKSIANLAIIKDMYGELDDAQADFRKAISMAEKIENKELLAFLYSELGVSFTYSNNLIRSREYYQKSYNLYRLFNNGERLSYLSSNIGSLYLQISNYKSAHRSYSEGLKFAGENKLGQILNLTGIADVYANESNYSKALKYYERAKQIADSIKDISSLVKIQEGIGSLFYNINRPVKSLNIFKELELKIESEKMPFELISLYAKVGTILTSLDSLKKAEDYYLKGIELAEQTGDVYNSILLKTEISHNFYKLNNLSEAVKHLTAASKVASKYELTQILALQDLYWGKIYAAQNKNVYARKKFLSSFQMGKSVQDLNTQVESGYLLARNFENSNQMVEAKKWYLSTIDLIEKTSYPLALNQEIQIAHFAGMNDIYHSLAEFYLTQGEFKEAFTILEKSRSRNTKANLDRLKLISQLQDRADYNKLIDLQWMTESGLYNKAETDSLKQQLNEVIFKITEKDNSITQILEKNNLIDLFELQKGLEEDEYLISVYVADKFITLFKLSSKDFSAEIVGLSRDSLLSMLGSISPIYKYGLESEEIYINEDLFSFNSFAAYKLYRRVFHDFLSSVPKESNLIASLPPELVKLPLELLVTEWAEDDSPYYYGNKNFLLNNFQIVYTPSAKIFDIQKKKNEPRDEQNLLIGDPFINKSEFTLSVRSGLIEDDISQARNIRLFPLEFSREEITNIDGKIANNIVLLSEDATESNFKQNAPASNVIHISSHSFLLKDQPLIIFSPEEDMAEDGFLELGEIVQLNLNSDMVVLSSCRSGLGRIDEAEGIIGMQKAFFDAGSKSVLVALWDVSDKYTSYLMQDFYKYLTEGNSKPEALRKAKLNFIKNHSPNPYYWSAFVLSGNTSPIKFESTSLNTLAYYIIGLIIFGLFFFLITKKKMFLPRKN